LVITSLAAGPHGHQPFWTPPATLYLRVDFLITVVTSLALSSGERRAIAARRDCPIGASRWAWSYRNIEIKFQESVTQERADKRTMMFLWLN
jgi:hypothetical protein